MLGDKKSVPQNDSKSVPVKMPFEEKSDSQVYHKLGKMRCEKYTTQMMIDDNTSIPAKCKSS